MIPALNIDASDPQFTLIGISDADDPGTAGYTLVKLTPSQASRLEGPWYAYDQSTDRIEAINETAALPLQLLLMAYYAGRTAANANVPGFTKVVGTNPVSHHLASSPNIQAIGRKALAYHAATSGLPGPGALIQLSPQAHAQAAASMLQMLQGMPKLTPAQASLLDYPTEPAEPPVQAEQDSIDQLDRELAGLDEFLNDVRGHTGGGL